MDVFLKLAGGALGLLVPALFVLALGQGIDRALPDAKKAAAKARLVAVVALWTIIVWGCALGGVISYHDGDRFPRVLIFLVVPVAVGLGAMARSGFRAVVDRVPAPTLVGVQAFRFAGAAFLLIAYLGILPSAFAAGGVGDIATGLLATLAAIRLTKAGSSPLFWGFTLVGLVDLVNVAVLLVAYDPIWFHGHPTSAPMADFALVMIPAIAAPFALLLHLYAVRNVLVSAGRRS
jgi:hypothetical protein